MKGVQLKLTPEQIRSTLNLDPSYDIIGATFDMLSRDVILIVTGPDLPEVQEGSTYPDAHLDSHPADTFFKDRHRHIIPD